MIRGVIIVAERAFVNQSFGAGAFDRMVRELPAELAQPLQGIPLAQAWYPLDAQLGLIDIGSRLFGIDDFPERLGRFDAEFDRNIIHRFLLRLTSPLWMLERGGGIWRDFHTSGRWDVVRGGGPRTLQGTLHDFARIHRGFCRVLTGFITCAGQLTGAREFRITHRRCRADGHQACVFEGAW